MARTRWCRRRRPPRPPAANAPSSATTRTVRASRSRTRHDSTRGRARRHVLVRAGPVAPGIVLLALVLGLGVWIPAPVEMLVRDAAAFMEVP